MRPNPPESNAATEQISIDNDTIAAIATPPGYGGVGILRVSGPLAATIARSILGRLPEARHAQLANFLIHEHGDPVIIDRGIALYFQAPHSFTGDDIIEFQCHGGPVILDKLLREVARLGARHAEPGEFTRRAYLNGLIDLAQAEAVADLINATSSEAAQSAMRSLQGIFSNRITEIESALVQLRVYVEAAIDFPEEEIDFLADTQLATRLQDIRLLLQETLASARQGSLLREGMTVVLAGKPNAGKSSLLNALAGREIAIVTDIAGTTRDLLREHLQIDGLPLHIVDTAGIRVDPDQVERIGIERARQQAATADRLLWLVDGTQARDADPAEICHLLAISPADLGRVTVVYTKADLSGSPTGELKPGTPASMAISAITGAGLDTLRHHLRDSVGYRGGEGVFTARRRHLDALQQTLALLDHGVDQLVLYRAGELLAEDLRLAQEALGTITGKLLPDDLLGEIFASFCIGK